MKRSFEEEFPEWCKIKYHATYNIRKVLKLEIGQTMVRFDTMPFSMKWGVYLEFFDEEDILIEILSWRIGARKCFDWVIRSEICFRNVKEVKTRKEAMQAALSKAIEIYDHPSNSDKKDK